MPNKSEEPQIDPLPENQTAKTEPVIEQWQGTPQPVAIPPATAPILYRIPTDKPVVFLGLDDGWFKTLEAHDWLLQHRLPFTLFLTNEAVKTDYAYFQDLQDAGMTIQDHTLNHADMSILSLEQQQADICTTADIYQTQFGKRPTLFRPPYGAFNVVTSQAAANCGMKAVVSWHAKVNGGTIQFQDNNTSFLPGDIVLMHFRPEFLQDIKAFMDQIEKDHLQVGRLEDWIQ